jgi:hypothetical protein
MGVRTLSAMHIADCHTLMLPPLHRGSETERPSRTTSIVYGNPVKRPELAGCGYRITIGRLDGMDELVEVLFNYLNVLLVGTRMRNTRCPSCGGPVLVSGPMFDGGSCCPHCPTLVRVPDWYTRLVLFVSYVIGLAFAWLYGARDMLAFWLFFVSAVPLALPFLSLVLRLALIACPPRLVAGKPQSGIITLDLGG